MNTLQKIDIWNAKHHSIAMDILRVALGLILVLKAIVFAANPHEVRILLTNSLFDPISMLFTHYIVMVHFAGGLMIMLGLLTRLSVAFQIPILLAAVLLTGRVEMFSFYNATLQAVIVLIMLIVFFFYGSGSFSADSYLRTHKDR